MTHDRQTPRPLRLLGLAIFAAITLIGFAAAPISIPPISPARLLGWWEHTGTAGATISVVWIAGLVLAAWLVVLSAIGITVATVDSARAARLWGRIAPRSIRRALAVGVALSVATPSVGGAAEGPVEELPEIRDLGAVAEIGDAPLPLLTDLGVLPDSSQPQSPAPNESSAESTPDQWVVQTGDHLWKIAEETLSDRGAGTNDQATERYWRRLIDQNRDAIGPNADLIYAGLTLTLPD